MKKTMALDKTMRNTPDGWRWVRLDNIATIISGQHILESDYNQSHRGVGYLTGPADFGLKQPVVTKWTEHPRVLCEPFDVLVTVKGAGVGKLNLAPDEPVAIGRQLMAIRANPDLTDRLFLSSYLATLLQHFQDKATGATVPGLSRGDLQSLVVPIPELAVQQRIAEILRNKMGAAARARAAARDRLEAALALPAAIARDSVRTGDTQRLLLRECLAEVKSGVGSDWPRYPVLGATREGLAPAKEGVGKAPERYKLVDPVTVFYNPMRILLGSIAMVDEGDATGITSPDYVVVKGRPGILDTRWFYYWFRSAHGARLIESLSRGAVRERILFNRLAIGEILLPDYDTQLRASEQMKHVGSIVENIQQEIETIDALPSAILREVFAGGA